MTSTQQAIILTSIIGTVLSEYKEDELTNPVKELKRVCSRFMVKQSGTKLLPFIGARIVDPKKHKQFVSSVLVGDKIWKDALDRYISQSLTIDAVSIITAVYEFAPGILAKHANITKNRIADYQREGTNGDEKHKRDGCIIGGYLIERLNAEMGIKINGRLKALKSKVESDLKVA